MANNAIALQARAPQSSGLGGIIQQNAQLINMMTQQRAAEAERAQRQAKMEQDAAVAKQTLEEGGYKTMSAQQKAIKDFMELSYEGIRQSRNPEDVMVIANALKQQFNNPVFHHMIDVTVNSLPQDPAQFSTWKDQSLFNTMSSADQMGFKIPKPKAELTYGTKGEMQETRTGGILGTDQGVYPLQSYELPQVPATPTRKGTVQVEPSVTVEDGQGGPYEPAPQAMAPGATPSDPVVDLRNALANVRNDAEYQQWLNAAGRIFPDFAAEARQYTPKFNPAVVQRMIAAADGYIKGQDPDQAAAAPPPATAAADFPMVAGPRGGPYVPTGQQAYGRNPTMGQYPGSALVPLPRVAAEAAAGRPSGAEIRRNKQIEKDVEIQSDIQKSANDQKRGAQNFFKVTGVDLKTKRDPVANLIRKSTSGAIEAVGAELMGAVPEQIGGGATEGAKAIGELETIAATITNNLLGGKLGTGISNEDRKMIERMVGDIANPYIPAGKRLAAWNRVKQIQMSYLGGAATPTATRPAAAQRRTPVGKPPAGVSAEDWKYMTPQERALWQK